MCQGLPKSASFHGRLLEIDRELAANAKKGSCAVCRGPLHVANYTRQPRGVPPEIGGGDHDKRYSFCCGHDGCRKRLTPVSVRFLDSLVYTSVIVMLAAMMTQGPNAKRVRVVAAELSVDPRTVLRWVELWRDNVPLTRCWQALRGTLASSVDASALPLSVYDVIEATDDEERMIRLLQTFRDLSQSERMQARTAGVA